MPLRAQPSSQLAGLEIDKAAAEYLAHLQESWLQWMSSFYQDRPEVADGRVDSVRTSLELLGFERIPDLSIGAAVRSVESARHGNLERARWGLEAAERLDGGRPETAFARAVVSWESGERLHAVGHHLRGWARMLNIPAFRFLWLQSLLLGALAAALLAGAAFVLVAAAVHGGDLYRSLHELFGGRLPPLMVHGLTWVLLLWPLALPGGVMWLVLYLSTLLWAFMGPSSRVVLVVIWVVAGLTPVLVAAQERRLEIATSPPAHVVGALVERRLYGGFFSDLAVLRSALPESSEVLAVLGDLHRGMGQWEPARERYEQVLEIDPEDAAALVNLGAYFFRKGDYGSAIPLFHRAAGLDDRSAVAYFNLSQAYSQSYLFSEQRRALSQAREIDDLRVNRWLAQAQTDRVITVDGRRARSVAIMSQLEATWRSQTSEILTPLRYISLGLPLGALALSLLFGGLLTVRETGGVPFQGSAVARALRVAVPGLESMAAGEGGRAYLALLGAAVCVVLLLGRGLGYPIPWGIPPGPALPVALGLGGLVLFYGSRIWWDIRTNL